MRAISKILFSILVIFGISQVSNASSVTPVSPPQNAFYVTNDTGYTLIYGKVDSNGNPIPYTTKKLLAAPHGGGYVTFSNAEVGQQIGAIIYYIDNKKGIEAAPIVMFDDGCNLAVFDNTFEVATTLTQTGGTINIKHLIKN